MDIIEKIINDFEKRNVEKMYFNTWEYNIERGDAYKFKDKGYELIYNGFNSHDCCTQFTIKKLSEV